MMFAYELQRRIQASGLRARVQVCHPGAARTNLLRDTAGPLHKTLWRLIRPLAQSAEKGAWPEVMCATEAELGPTRLYGPTRFEMVGPVGECPLHPCALDVEMAARLWTLSEQKTRLSWAL